MNRVYKVIWSKVRHCYVVVSELTRRQGKSNVKSICPRAGAAAVLAAAALTGTLLTGPVWAAEATQQPKAVQAETKADDAKKADTEQTAEEELLVKAGSIAAASTGDPSKDENNNLAWGSGAGVTGGTTENPTKNSVAIGTNAAVHTDNSVAIGNGASIAHFDGEGNNVAIGNNAGTNGQDAAAIGASAKAAGSHAVALGGGASAGESSTAIGGHSIANNNSIAIGAFYDPDNTHGAEGSGNTVEQTHANGSKSIAIGVQAGATTENSIAFGYGAGVSQTDGVAIGTGAHNNAGSGLSGSVALGANTAVDTDRRTDASNYNDTYIGYDPKTQTGKPQDWKGSSEYNGNNPVWKATDGAISVGASSKDGSYNIAFDQEGHERTRQITHVAAGSQLTDAVNVAQLKNLRDYVDSLSPVAGNANWWNLTTNGGQGNGNEAVKIGKDSTVDMSGAKDTVKVDTNGNPTKETGDEHQNITVTKTDKADGTGTDVSYQLNDVLHVGTSKDNKTITIDGQKGEITGLTNREWKQYNYDNLVDNKPVNIYADSGKAVTEAQLRQALENLPEQIQITGGKGLWYGTQMKPAGAVIHDVSNRSIAMGNGAVIYGGTSLSGGEKASDNIAMGGYAAISTEHTEDYHQAEGNIVIGSFASAVGKNQGHIGYSKGQDYDKPDHDIDEATVIGMGAKSEMSYSTALGAHSLVSREDYIEDGDEGVVNGIKDDAGVDGTMGVVSVGNSRGFSNLPDPNRHNGTGAYTRRIINVSRGQINEKSTDAINGSQLYRAVSSSIQYDRKDPDDKNILPLDPDDINKNSITFEGDTYDSTTHKGGTELHNVAYAKDEEGSAAVNVDKLKDYVSENGGSWNLTANGEGSKEIRKGNTVDFTGANGVKVSKTDSDNGANVTVGLDKDIVLGTPGKDGEKGEAGSIGLVGPAGKDGVNGTTTIRTETGAPGVNGQDGEDGITRIIYKDPADNDHQVATLDEGMKFKGDINDAQGVKLNKQVNIVGGQTDESKLSDGANIGVVTGTTDADGNLQLDVKLAKELTGLTSVTIGGDADGKGAVIINNEGINAGGKVITNAGTSTATSGTDVVNIDYLNNKLNNLPTGSATDYRLINGTDTIKAAEGNNPAVKGYNVKADGTVELTVQNGEGENAAKQTVNIGGIATKAQQEENTEDIKNLDDFAVKYDKNTDNTVNKNSVTLGGAEYTTKTENGTTTHEGGTTLTNVAYADISKAKNGSQAVNVDLLKDQIAEAGKAAAKADFYLKNGTAELGEDVSYGEGEAKVTTGYKADDKGNIDMTVTNENGEKKHVVLTDIASKKQQDTNTTNITKNTTAITNLGEKLEGAVMYNTKEENGKTVVDKSGVKLGGDEYSHTANTDGSVTTAGGTKITNVAYAQDSEGSAAVNVDKLKDYVAANGGGSWNLTANGADSKEIKKGNTVDFTGANGVKVSKENTADGAKVTVGLDNQITLGEAGKDGADGKDGSITIIHDNKETTITLNGKDGKPGVDGKDGITRIEYADKDGSKQEVATLNDGLKFKGDDETVIAKKLNEQLDIVGGADSTKLTDGNIGVVSGTDGALHVQLAKDIKGLDSINIGGTTNQDGTVTGGINISKDGIDAGGKVITNAGTSQNTSGNDVVNIDYLNSKLNNYSSNDYRVVEGKHTDAEGKEVTGYKANADGTITMTVKDKSGKGQDETVTLVDVASKAQQDTNTTNIKSNTDNITDVQNTLKGAVMYKEDADKEDGYDKNYVNLGGDEYTTQDGKHTGGTHITNVAYADDTNGSEAVNVDYLNDKVQKTNEEIVNKGFGLSADDNQKVTKSLGETIKVTGDGKNISTSVDNGSIKVSLNKDLVIGTPGKDGEKGEAGSIGLVGPAGKDGVNGTTTIRTETGAPGVDGKDGEDGITRIIYKDPAGNDHQVATLNDGMKFKGDDETVIAKKLNDQLDIVGGATGALTDGNIGVVSDNGALHVKLAKDVQLGTEGSIAIGGTKDDAGQYKDQITINKDGINAGNKQITNVAAGGITENSTNAVNGGEVFAKTGDLQYKHSDNSDLKYVAQGDNLTTSVGKLDEAISKVNTDFGNAKFGLTGDDGTTAVTQKLNSNIQVKGADGITSTVVEDEQGAKHLEIGLGDTLTVGNGKDGADGKDGSITIINKDGTQGTIGINGKNGKDGLDGTSITRIEYADKDGNKQEIATMNDGLRFAGDNYVSGDTSTVAYRKLNEKLDITGGAKGDLTDGNIGVIASNNGLEVKLAKDVKGLNSITTNNAYVTNVGDTDNSVTNKKYVDDRITNINTDLTNKGFGIGAELGGDVKKKLGETISIVGDKNVNTSVVDGKIQIALENRVVLGDESTDQQIVLNGSAGRANIGGVVIGNQDGGNYVTSLDNKTWDKDNIVSGRGATEDQLKALQEALNKQDAGNVKYHVKEDGTVDYTSVVLGGGDHYEAYTSEGHRGGTHITNVAYATGSNGGEAVNVDYLKDQIADVKTETANKELHIKEGQYTVGAVKENTITMQLADGNGNLTGKTVELKDVAKASDVGNVSEIDPSLKNEDGSKTTVVDAVNNLNNKVGDLNYSKVEGTEIADGDNTTTAIGKLDNKIDDIGNKVEQAEKNHTTVSNGNGITVVDKGQKDENGNISKHEYEVSISNDFTLKGETKNEDGTTTENGNSIHVDANKGQLTVTGKNGDTTNNVVIDGQTGTVSGLTNTTWDSTLVDKAAADGGYKGSTKAATESQLQQAMAGAVQYDRKEDGSVDNTHITLNKGGDAVTMTNVADGKVEEGSKDAVNGGQLYNVQQQVEGNSTAITNVARGLSNLDGRVDKVGAGAAALAALHPLDFDPDDKWDFAAGYGNYRSASAVAMGAYYRPNEDTMFSVGGTFGNGENMVNAGVSFKLGQGNNISTSRVAMAKEIKDLRNELEAMKKAMVEVHSGKQLDTSKLQLFPDVPKNHWAYEYIAVLAGNGLIQGYPDGTFDGGRTMTRYEFAAMLYRAMQQGAVLSDKILTEFAPELERFRIDTIARDKNGNPTIERVRVNK